MPNKKSAQVELGTFFMFGIHSWGEQDFALLRYATSVRVPLTQIVKTKNPSSELMGFSFFTTCVGRAGFEPAKT